MKLGHIFRTMIEVGRRADWRDEATFDAQLAARRREYDALTGVAKQFYDTERLWNPFGCSRVCAGDPELEVRGMAVGIDCTLPDLLYVERLRDRGRRIDAYLAHHGIPPAGTSYDDINNTHYQVLIDYGVPAETASRVVSDAIRGYYLRMAGEPFGFERYTDMALFSVHNPMDNLASLYAAQLFAREKPRTLAEVIEALLSFDEFAISARAGVPPRIAVGAPDAEAGHIYFDALGGICLNDGELAALLATGRVQTVLRLTYNNCIRICREAGVNLIFFPHDAHDNVGINLMLDQLVAEEELDIIPVGHFHRVPRPLLTDFRWPKRG
jgi:hypothetical protein